MRWTDLLIRFRDIRFRSPRAIERLADELAEQAQSLVLRRVRKRVGRMTACEARGYVRAHATAVVDKQVEARMLADSLPASIRPLLVERVAQRVVDQTLREAAAVETLVAIARAA
jgi:hypothetical protein